MAAPSTFSRSRTTRDKPKRLLVLGEIGDGMTTLINALRDPERIEAAEAGMTKTIAAYV